jgi:Polyketide cyclase / dehydrase and lipid transport
VSSIISQSREIPAPAAAVFELLARPERHSLIDGSGSVRGARAGGPDRLFLGASFGMNMRIGLPYRILNEVVEFDEGSRIAWRHFAGHVWRYILEPLPAGADTSRPATMLTEQFDPTHAGSPLTLKLLGFRRRNERSIQRTLDRIAELARAGTI